MKCEWKWYKEVAYENLLNLLWLSYTISHSGKLQLIALHRCLCCVNWNETDQGEMIHNASCSKLNLMRFVHISQDGNDCVLAPPSAKNDKLYAKGFPLSKMRSHSLSFKIFKCVFVLEINFGGLTGFIISDSKYSQWTLLNSHYLPLLWK